MTEFPGIPSGQSSVPPGAPEGAGPFPHPPSFYPPGAYRPPQYPSFPPAPARRSNGLAFASLSMGVLGLITSPLLIGLGLGITAVAMGVTARRRVKRGEATHGGVALIGIVFGVLAAVAGSAVLALMVFGFAIGEFDEDYQHCVGEHNGMAQYCQQYR
jgi:hypothetical protein